MYELDRLGFVGSYGCSLKKCCSVGNRTSFGPNGHGRMPSATRDLSSKWFAALKGSPYKKYSPADLALLEDPAKR